MDQTKTHPICIPYPAQGHIGPMLRLTKLLHSLGGFHINFINIDFNHRRLLKSQGSDSLSSLPDFQFASIPDGLLPPANPDATQDIPALCQSIRVNFLEPFVKLVEDLNGSDEIPPVTCIVLDGVMSFMLAAAEQLNIPEVVFFTTSACGFMGYVDHYGELVARGYVPFKDESWFTNGYLETEIDWIKGMEGIRLKDFPTFIRTMDPNDIMLNYNIEQTANSTKAKAITLNTYDDLEKTVLDAIQNKFKNQIYTIGLLQLLERGLPDRGELDKLGSNLWKEEKGCLEWLDEREKDSVIYVNFGSITVLSGEEMREFAWGLVDSGQFFVWIIRPDLVTGESAVLPEEFLEATKERVYTLSIESILISIQKGMLARWCPQEEVLTHPSIGGFLSHCGWNSTIETISEGVPIICWPFFAEPQTNCRYACEKWAVGMEIEGGVTREKVEWLVRELMEGEKGKEMRKNALEWKKKARMATRVGGSSYKNLERLINETLLGKY